MLHDILDRMKSIELLSKCASRRISSDIRCTKVRETLSIRTVQVSTIDPARICLMPSGDRRRSTRRRANRRHRLVQNYPLFLRDGCWESSLDISV